MARMEEVLEEHAPGFGALVVGRHVAGPADLEEQNPSLVGGALGGGTAAAYQQLFLRPMPGLGRADTPVDRLFLASASAHPGGGRARRTGRERGPRRAGPRPGGDRGAVRRGRLGRPPRHLPLTHRRYGPLIRGRLYGPRPLRRVVVERGDWPSR